MTRIETGWVTTEEVLKATWLSPRQFVWYKEQDVCPKALRVGSRDALYPAWTIDLLQWVIRLRFEEVPLAIIKEFIPLWLSRDTGFAGRSSIEYDGLWSIDMDSLATLQDRRSFWWPSMVESIP